MKLILLLLVTGTETHNPATLYTQNYARARACAHTHTHTHTHTYTHTHTHTCTFLINIEMVGKVSADVITPMNSGTILENKPSRHTTVMDQGRLGHVHHQVIKKVTIAHKTWWEILSPTKKCLVTNSKAIRLVPTMNQHEL